MLISIHMDLALVIINKGNSSGEKIRMRTQPSAHARACKTARVDTFLQKDRQTSRIQPPFFSSQCSVHYNTTDTATLKLCTLQITYPLPKRGPSPQEQKHQQKKNTATARLTGYASYCVFAGCKRYTLQCQYVLHQLSCP